jgi:hypothetical protein
VYVFPTSVFHSSFGTLREKKNAFSMDFEELQRHLDNLINAQNNRPIPEFEGYSPNEMHQLLHFTFGEDSAIRLQKISGTQYQQVPIWNLVKYLTGLIEDAGEIKLTKKGFLPTKVVSELYRQGFLKEDHIEKGITKLYKEMDSISVHLARILAELAGLIKKRKGKLTLTKSSAELIVDDHALLRLLLATFTSKLNWAYLDGYGENQIGQLGCGFSLILLSKYGNEKQLDSFYAEKYFRAYPQLLEGVEPTFGTLESYAAACYALRTFEKFMRFFGLISTAEEGRGFDSITYVTKTALFDKLISCRPPGNPQNKQ